MAGTDRQRPLIAEGPAIILVEPQLPENIGMVARAMANFGLAELRLVKPREEFPNDKARSAASRADHIIDAAQVFDDLPSAIKDLHFVYATTARERDAFKQVRGPVEAGQVLRQRFNNGEKTGILFGRERFGLNNDEVSLADELVTFPVNPAFSSLNIAQAVLLMSYEWMKSGLEKQTDTAFRGPELEPAPKEQLQGFFNHLEDALQARGYFRPMARKEIMVNNLRGVLTRAGFSDSESETPARRSCLARLFQSERLRAAPVRRKGASARNHQRRKSAGISRAMSEETADRPIIVFDSGIGGLTVLREARVLMPDRRFVYIADDAGFPYGEWEEGALCSRIVAMFASLIAEHDPEIAIIACNTASTLVLDDLRKAYPAVPFVGTVPAIKPAAERTSSGFVSVLATPGTVKRAYTRDLIQSFATKCHVRLVGSQNSGCHGRSAYSRRPHR